MTVRGSSSRIPTIYSLAEYRVKIAPAVHDVLQKHYGPTDTGRFQQILNFMKIPPRQTVLRLTRYRDDSRQDRVQELQDKVDAWLKEEQEKFSGNGKKQPPPHIDARVRPHSILDDVITIDVAVKTNDSANYSNLATATIPDPHDCPLLAEFSSNGNATTRHCRQASGWPMTHRVVMVDRLAGEAMLRGADCFVRGILAADLHIRPGDIVAVYADLHGGVSRGTTVDQYHGTCLFLGLGYSFCSRTQYFSQATGRALRLSVYSRAGPILPPLDDWLRDGTLFAQNLPSLVVGHVLQPQPGDVVYDMCAAPGGKTSHLALLTRGKATIVMSDKSRRKVLAARELFQQLNCNSCIVPLHLDGTASVCNDNGPNVVRQSVQELIAKAKTDTDGLLQIDKFFPESFDRILLDPPCSALGLRPKLQVIQKTDKDLVSFASYQTRFIAPAVRLLKQGGKLVYSTCTFHARENEGMVHYILENHPEMKLLPIDIPLGGPGLPNQGLSPEDGAKVKRFDPTVAEDTMGFFIASFVKQKK